MQHSYTKQIPPEIEVLCQMIETGPRDQKFEALGKLEQLGKGFLNEIHSRLNPLVGQGKNDIDMPLEFYIATVLASLGDEDENILREINLHLALVRQGGGGIYEQENLITIKYVAVRALSNIRRSDVITILMNMLQDESISIRMAAMWALAAQGAETARNYLESMAKKPESEERRAAQASLDLFGRASFDQVQARKFELDRMHGINW